MLRLIIRKEFFSHLLSFRLWTGYILCIVLIPFIMSISIKQYEERIQNYNLEIGRITKETREQFVYSFIRPTIVRKPEALSILCTGIEDNIGAEVKIRLGEIPFMPTDRLFGRYNPFITNMTSVDPTFVLFIILSLFSIILMYDAISGEKESGLLRQILSNPLYRRQILFGKYLGALYVVILFLLCVYILIVLLMYLSPLITLTTEDILKIGTLFLTSVLYSSIFILIGLAVSSRMENSSTSLLSSVFIWIILIVIIPNGSIYLVRTLSHIQSMYDINTNIAALNAEKQKLTVYPPPPKTLAILRLNWRQGDDGEFLTANETREGYDHFLKTSDIDTKLLLQYAEKKRDVHQKYIDAMMKQSNIVTSISTISPSFLFQKVSETMVGTDNNAYHTFIERARLYRGEIVKYLERKRLTAPYKYITPDDDNLIRPFNEWLRYWTNGKYSSYEQLYDGRSEEEGFGLFYAAFDTVGRMERYREISYPYVDVGDLPIFQYKSSTYVERFLDCFPQIIIMLIVNLLLFLLSLRLFNTFDVR